MELSVEWIASLVHSAYKAALGHPDDSQLSEGPRNRARSQNFVTILAAEIRNACPAATVFSRDWKDNKAEFKVNEMLFDVHACETDTLTTVKGLRIKYISRSLIQIESEFAKDNREAAIDFSKLVVGSAPLKVFIGSKTATPEGTRDALLPVARVAAASGADVLGVFLPHPSAWNVGGDFDPNDVEAFCFQQDSWTPIDQRGDC